jgi:antitoxin HigA-1
MDELKPMHYPSHPGEFISEVYLQPFGLSGRALARQLDVSASTLSRVLGGARRITPEMALRLSKAIGRSAESWMAMQNAHDLWVARESLDLSRVQPLELVSE